MRGNVLASWPTSGPAGTSTRVHITSLIWLPEIIEKLEVKHGVTTEEVEEVFELGAAFRALILSGRDMTGAERLHLEETLDRLERLIDLEQAEQVQPEETLHIPVFHML